ncbi:MAG: hypothetical protein WC614_09315 [bacterium]
MRVRNSPFNFTGTIRGMSPEQAKRMFNYNMPPDAQGVTFRFQNNKTYIVPYYPEKYNNHSEKSAAFKTNTEIFSMLNKICPQIRKTIIYPAWTPLVDKYKEKHFSAYHLFFSINRRQLKYGLENLIFTMGELTPPQLNLLEFKNSVMSFQQENPQPGYDLGFISIDRKTLEVETFAPVKYGERAVSLKVKSGEGVVFAYHRRGKEYSVAVNVAIR